MPDLSQLKGSLSGEWEVPVTRNAKITPVNEGGGGSLTAGSISALRVTGTSHSPLSAGVESIASDHRPSPSLDRIYQLGLWSAIFFAIFLRLPPNKSPDSAAPFTSFDPVGFAIFATHARGTASEAGGTPFF